MRAIIGDEIRVPIVWCEFGTCISRYTDDNALDEGDLRSRALTAGWRHDGLGRIACPKCARDDSGFQPGRPPRPAVGRQPRPGPGTGTGTGPGLRRWPAR